MNAYTMFLYFIVLAKVMYSLSVLLQFTELIGWDYFSNDFCERNKERFEHLYVLLMSSLVIYIFRNRAKGVSVSSSRIGSKLTFRWMRARMTIKKRVTCSMSQPILSFPPSNHRSTIRPLVYPPKKNWHFLVQPSSSEWWSVIKRYF